MHGWSDNETSQGAVYYKSGQ